MSQNLNDPILSPSTERLGAPYRTFGSTVGIFLLAVLLVVPSFWAYARIRSGAKARSHNYEVIIRGNALLSALSDAETGQRGFVVTGDATYLQPYLTALERMPILLDGLRKTTKIPSAQRHLEAMLPLVKAKVTEMDRVIALRRNQDFEAALAHVKTGEGKQIMDELRTELTSFLQIENNALAEHDADFQTNMGNLFVVIVIIGLFTLMVALVFIDGLRRKAVQRLKNLAHQETKNLLELQEKNSASLQNVNASLLESEEKLAVTLNSIGDAVIATDGMAIVRLMNPVAEELTGWTFAEAKGRSIDDVFRIISEETRIPTLAPIIATLDHGTVQGLANHTLLIARDGTEIAIADSCGPIRDHEGQVVGAVLVFRNVTKDNAAQRSLRDSLALIDAVLQSVGDGIITIKAHGGMIEKINPAAERMFGYDASELVGQSLSSLIPKLDQDQIVGSLESFQASYQSLTGERDIETLGRRKDGHLFPLEMTTTEMSLGGQRYFTGILRDLSSRREAEAALIKAGALQSAIFNSANFSSIATDAKGVIQIFNVGAERMLGYAAADVMNKITPADISDPEEVIARAKSLTLELGTNITPGFEALVFKASRGIEDIYELTYIRKDGSRFPAVVSVTALRDAEKSIIGYLLIGTDNTARKQVEEERKLLDQQLRENEERFRTLADNISQLAWMGDAQGSLFWYNQRWFDYTGTTLEEMHGWGWQKVHHPDHEQRVVEGFKHCLETGEVWEDTFPLRGADGQYRWFLSRALPIRDEHGAVLRWFGTNTDITERIEAGALQSAIFNSANFSSIATDANGVIQIFNVGAERMLGYSAADVMNKITPADISDPMELVARARALSLGAGTPIKPGFEALVFKATRGIEDIYELTYIRKDGSRLPAVVSVTALRDAKNAIIGYLLIGTDNTVRLVIEAERTRLDLALQDKNVELQNAKVAADKANLAKSEFLSSMSHELRSPLNAILGFAQLMDSATPPATEQQKASIDRILHAGWYLLELINEILDLAVVESGKLSISEEPVSLEEVMIDCRFIIEPQCQKRGITLAIPAFPSPIYVRADRVRLKQVLINLLSNAVKYNRPHGTVEVVCSVATPGRIRITVKDTGQGLSPDQIRQLFQPFNRLGQERSIVEGTGIGLVMSKLLVELMGGDIGVRSAVGIGSEFWYDLKSENAPIQMRAPGMESIDIAAEGSRSREVRTILYVEDNPANLELVSQLVGRRPDLCLLGVEDAIIGLRMAREKHPEVILMDINLPGMSGIQAMKLLREDPSTCHIPVIALSANAMTGDIKKGMDEGFFRYITKPIVVSVLMRTIDEALEFEGNATLGSK